VPPTFGQISVKYYFFMTTLNFFYSNSPLWDDAQISAANSSTTWSTLYFGDRV